MEYYDATGGAHAHLSWTAVNVTIANWRGEYFNNSSLTGGPSLIRDDASVDFNWGNGSPATGIQSDNFSARWSRTLVLPAGRYKFTTRTDDGVRLWVNNSLVIDRWVNQALTTHEGEIELPGGNVTIKMEYFDRTGGAEAHLSWTTVSAPPSNGGSGQGGPTSGSATVRSTYLNVRQGPAVTYPVMTTIAKNTVVQIGAYRNATATWVMIVLADGRTGWSYAPYLQTNVNIGSLPLWTGGTSGAPTSGATATVAGANYLNVRSGPGTTYAPILAIPRGTVVTLIGRNSSGGWLKIQLPRGTQGWSSASYLQPRYIVSDLLILEN
jgi:uncharacterized protein YraI